MGAHAPEPIESATGSRLIRRRPIWFVVGCMTLSFTVSCRNVGTPVSSITSRNPADGVVARQPTEREKTTTTSDRRSVTTSSKTNSEASDEGHSEPDAVRDTDEMALTGPPVRRTTSDIVQTNRTTLADGQDDQSFVTILRFDDATQTTSNRLASNTQDKNAPARDSELTERPKSLRLTFPAELPGAASPTISLPVSDIDHPERKMAAINTLFPPASIPKSLDVPNDRVMTLEELEELALLNSPIIAQSLAAITMNQGTAIQAGIYPNPVFGYEADTVGSTFTRNYQGTYVAQTIKVAGKLPLARAAANMDLMNSQLAYERTRQQVLHDVRTGYFSVLVSQEAIRINEALVRFTNQVYAIMIERLKNGEQAGYELAQLRTLVKQAQTILVNSQNRYISSWKQLAAATGTPELPLALLEGRVDMPVPNLDYDTLLDRVLSVHPDLQASRNLEAQARLQLRLQRAIPIPDPTIAGAFQNDSTSPGFQRTSYNLNVSIPVPIFDRNQGNIRNALGKLEMNSRQYAVTTNQLTSQLAEAFERYQNGRFQSEYYRTQILPDLARAYRGVYDRHISNSDKVAFGDIIVAQQNLAGGVSIYITSLWTQWNAAVDLANLMQLSDFRSLFSDLPPVPDRTTEPTPAEATWEGVQP